MAHVSQSAAWTVPYGDLGALRLTVQVFLAQHDLRIDILSGGTIVGEQGSTLLSCLSLLRFASPSLLPKRVSIDVLPDAGSVTVYAVCEDTFGLPKPSSTAERYEQQFSEWLHQLGNHVGVQARLDESLAMRRATGIAPSRYERSAPWWIPSDEELVWSPDDSVVMTDELESEPAPFLDTSETPEADEPIELDGIEDVSPDVELTEPALASTGFEEIVDQPLESAVQPASSWPENGSSTPEPIEAIEASEPVDLGPNVPEEVSRTRESAEEDLEPAADETPVVSPEISASPPEEQAVIAVEPGEVREQVPTVPEGISTKEGSTEQAAEPAAISEDQAASEPHEIGRSSPDEPAVIPMEPGAAGEQGLAASKEVSPNEEVSEGEATSASPVTSPSPPDQQRRGSRWGGFKLLTVRLGSWLATSKATSDELPQAVRLEAARGDECIDSGDWAGAVAHYDAALDAAKDSRPQPNSPDADLLTQTSLRRGTASFRHNQSLLDATKPTGRSSVELQKAIEATRLAIEDYGEAIRLSPDLAQAYFRRGEAHLFIARCEYGRYSAKRASAELEAAIMDLTAAIELTPSFAAALALRAIAHTLLNHKEEAEIDVGKAIGAGTDHVTMWRALGASKAWVIHKE